MLIIIVLTLASLLSKYGPSNGLNVSRFVREPLCDLEERLQNGCTEKVAGSPKSVVSCLLFCWTEKTTCLGSSLDENGNCFCHWDCPNMDRFCMDHNRNHHFMTRYCVNGKYNPLTSSCMCDPGYLGDRCNKYPRDCTALKDLGFPRGRYQVYIDPEGDGLNPLHVLCDVAHPSWYAVIFMRNDGHFDFNRTWSDYKRGFYDESKSNMWGGLETWAAMSKAGFKSHFVVTFHNQDSLNREYKEVVITDENDGYKITFGSSREYGEPYLMKEGYHFGDCLSSFKNISFSTWDKDNSVDGSGCGAVVGAGWWFSGPDCSTPCHLLGWNWNHTVQQNRLYSLEGLNMSNLKFRIEHFEIYFKM